MKTRLPFDEINAFEQRVKRHFDEQGHIASKEDCEDIIDELLDLFLLAYATAIEDVNRQFGTEIRLENVQETVYKPIDGKTWEDRVWDWFEAGGTVGDIVRIADTEAHRIGNTAAEDTAVQAGATTKTWVTMNDDRVRDTHDYLEMTTVPIGARFYSYDGDSARFPGDFGLPQNNINCRCILKYA